MKFNRPTLKIKVLDKGFVQYVDHMGSCKTISDAARCSFDKVKDEFDDKDEKLIKYLAREKHMLPFRHPTISLRVKMPIFVARQLMKHSVGMSCSEVSRRYVTGGPEFYLPEVWRKKPEDGIKQGSGEEFDKGTQGILGMMARMAVSRSVEDYDWMIENGVAPEMARMVLPAGLYTTVYWTGSLLSWFHLWDMRTENHAQLETQEYGWAVGAILCELFPKSFEALVHHSTTYTKEARREGITWYEDLYKM